MFSKISGIAIALLFLGSIYRCGIALQVPTADDSQRLGVSLDTLLKGRELYVNNCGACHNLYLPNKHTETEWIATLKNMQKPAKISHTQTAIILNYLSSGSKKEKQ